MIDIDELSQYKLTETSGFNIKKPDGEKRFTFAISAYDNASDGKKTNHRTLKLTSIKKVNLTYKKFPLKFKQAEKTITTLHNELKKYVYSLKPETAFNADNIDIVDEYFKIKYKKKKILEDSKKSMHDDLIQAVKCIGDESLRISDIDDIQYELDESCEGRITKQRRMCSRLNQLLTYIGRTSEKLQQESKTHKEIKYLEMGEAIELLENISGEFEKVFAGVALFSGLRIGEVLALTRKSVIRKNMELYIYQQLKRGKKLLPSGNPLPKGQKARKALRIPNNEDYIAQYLKLAKNDHEKFCKLRGEMCRKIKKVCKELWPDEPLKHLNYHDLRHCYAVHLLSKEIPLDQLSLFMGNSPAVCQDNYAGFVASNFTVISAYSKLK